MPKQFIGTSIVIETDESAQRIVGKTVCAGFEPHFVVIKGRHADTLGALAQFCGFNVYRY